MVCENDMFFDNNTETGGLDKDNIESKTNRVRLLTRLPNYDYLLTLISQGLNAIWFYKS